MGIKYQVKNKYGIQEDREVEKPIILKMDGFSIVIRKKGDTQDLKNAIKINCKSR